MPNKYKKVETLCIICNNSFYARKYEVKIGKGKYCPSCWYKKHPNWNKRYEKRQTSGYCLHDVLDNTPHQT
jgi:hypothetical protein